jgi:DNA-binding NarL/FixJ family response regulator
LRFDEAQSRLGLAGALLDSGDPTAAAEQVATSSRLLADVGATGLLERAGRLARAAAAAGPEPAATRDRGRLTRRETQVMQLVATGRSNAQIAAELVLSEHTVHRHVANILTKLDQPTRAAATAYAVTHGLV